MTLKNANIEISLMVEKPNIPACVEGKNHQYKTILRNHYHESGFKIDQYSLKIS